MTIGLIARAIGLGLLAATTITATSSATNFSFSFTNTVFNTPGTVTGRIFGLTDNATSAVTDVVLDSFPAAFGLPAAPVDIFALASFVADNSFTVSGGNITEDDLIFNFTDGGHLFQFRLTGTPDLLLNDLQRVNDPGTSNGIATGNAAGLSEVTFVNLSQPAAIAEPGSIVVLISGLALLGLAVRRRRA